MELRRDDYRAIKRMDRQQMAAELGRIYRRGYEAGVKSMATVKKDADRPAPKPAEISNG